MIEVEFRLTGAPETLRAVFNSPPMAPDNGREEETAHLESRYFDTSDQRLRAKEDLTPISRTRGQRRSRQLTINDPGMPACRIEAALGSDLEQTMVRKARQ